MSETKNEKFKEIYMENFSYVYDFIYMKVLHRETAEDICSETFTKAYAHIDSFDPNRAKVRTWLCTIARNCVYDHFKSSFKRRVDITDDLPDIPVEDEYSIIKNAVNEEVARLLKLLSDEERELLACRYGSKMSVKEIAEVYGVSQNAISLRIRRILEKCRKIEEKGGYNISDFLP